MEDVCEEINKLAIEYPFLKEITSIHGEHIEVTDVAVWGYYAYYDYLGDYYFHKWRSHRNQMSPCGAWLHKEQEGAIDIVGDVLTSVSVFKFAKSSNNEELKRLYQIFEKLYHTIGNLLPMGEGCNRGGSDYRGNLGNDSYSKKLEAIKNEFDECNKKIDPEIEKRIKDNETLGVGMMGIGKKCLNYWITTEWKMKKGTWKSFVNKNYLFDMVDESLKPISYVAEMQRNLSENQLDKLCTILADYIRMIIFRGYRIWKKEGQKTLNDNAKAELNDILTKLNLIKYCENIGKE